MSKQKNEFVQDFIPVKNIRHGIIETNDGRYIKILEIEPINFMLRSEEEQLGMSRQLHAVASKVMLYPSEKVMFKKYAGMIARNMQYVEKKPNIIPTFWGTVDAVGRKNHVQQEPITEALKQMLDKGYIARQERVLDDGKTVMVLAANWEELTRAGLWSA